MSLLDSSWSDFDSASMYSNECSFDISGTPGSTGVQPATTAAGARLRPKSNTSSERTDSYRFSMANLEETQEAELDAILGELNILEERGGAGDLRHGRSHSRTNSTISAATNTTLSSESGCSSVAADTLCSSGGSIASGMAGAGVTGGSISLHREPRTDSPDNDSAFSDTVSLMSSESSASSSVSSSHLKHLQGAAAAAAVAVGQGVPTNTIVASQQQHHQQQQQQQQQHLDGGKQAKIHLALQKLEQASVRRLFVKAFSADGASKSLLVDETMSCGHVTRLLADKNHVQMEPTWAIVEHLPEHQMERLFEDHEMLVDNLMLWNRDSKNRVLFLQRPDKVALFKTPEAFLPGTQMAPGSEHDEHTRAMLLDEFFTGGSQIALEGPLYMKNDAKKGWKRYHFVLRASGLHYYPKEKTRSAKDLLCLALFAGHEVYRGLGWKKKHKAPTDYTFALRCPKVPPGVKGIRSVKMLCAEDAATLDHWVTAIRVMKYGKKLFDNHRSLLDDLAREELDKLSAARSNSIGSIVSSVPSQCSTGSSNSSGSGSNNHLLNVPQAGVGAVGVTGNGNGAGNGSSNGRLSRASSSSSSGCLSDENNGFDSEFPTGTIKRKPSMKPNLPLTSMTRQLKEVGETTARHKESPSVGSMGSDGSGTLTRRHSRRRSEESTGSSSGTLKRRPMPTANRGSIESMSSSASTPTPGGSVLNTPVNFDPPPTTAATILGGGSRPTSVNGSPTIVEPPIPFCMTDSTFSLPPPPPPPTTDDPATMGADFSGSTLSLDSLPPPPPPNELDNSFSGSQLSLASMQLPPPPPPSGGQHGAATGSSSHLGAPVVQGSLSSTTATAPMNGGSGGVQLRCLTTTTTTTTTPSVAQSIKKLSNHVHPHPHLHHHHSHTLPSPAPAAAILKKETIYSKTLKPSALKAPPYKAPPPYTGGDGSAIADGGAMGTQTPPPPPPPTKSVSFAESPVLLRRKVCFEDEVVLLQDMVPPPSPRRLCASYNVGGPPAPPPRAEATRLSTTYTSPKRLSESSANPPHDFLKDLQRVMNKKWQVAQKCKLEPATTPHEVLGFRDIHGAASDLYSSATPYYRETANVSNWVQEHYGGAGPADGLYENLGSNMGLEPNYPIVPNVAPSTAGGSVLPHASLGAAPGGGSSAKKRPPPPPPKRSEKTQLTTTNSNNSGGTSTPQHHLHHPHHQHQLQHQQQHQQHQQQQHQLLNHHYLQ